MESNGWTVMVESERVIWQKNKMPMVIGQFLLEKLYESITEPDSLVFFLN